ncbi:MAG: aspartate kinase [Chitinophagaceae bacterium]
MQVLKFGGASVQDIERIKQVANIVQLYKNEQLLIVVSAIGKTTNALEKVVDAFYKQQPQTALDLFSVIKNQHIQYAKYLLVVQYNSCTQKFNDVFTEVEWLLHDKPVRSYDYYYDQIVCVGELLSTILVEHYFRECLINSKWVDVRDILRTDNNFRDANIDWNKTKEAVTAINFNAAPIYVTQGFIGATDDNESTTLGREGSDYSAAIFANLLQADKLTIWKDVAGVMSADPKQFPQAVLLNELNYEEVIEMAYYGAQVIHPKTIKPLQNKGIPLHVKCFLDTHLPGTIIHNKSIKNLPPIYVIKSNQVLIHCSSQDFSFVGEQPMIDLYEMLKQLKVRPNILQTGAVSLQICFDDNTDKMEELAFAASNIFHVEVERNLQLLTIRHYSDEILNSLIKDKTVVLMQKTTSTVQVLYR